jgi:hypothetical protein
VSVSTMSEAMIPEHENRVALAAYNLGEPVGRVPTFQ